MAKKSAKAKQKRREKLVKLHWDKRSDLKKKIINPELDDEERMEAVDKLNKMSPNGSKVRLRNRCSMTGRPRGYMRQFGISRVTFRQMALDGKIPGVKKASW